MPAEAIRRGVAGRRVPLLVVGGGIGGLAVSLALAQDGQAVHVLERSAEFAEIGAGIQLAPNATSVLDDLGLMSEIDRHAVYPARIALMSARSGRQLVSLDLGDPFRERYGHPYIVLHRHDLLATLLDACRRHPLVTLEPNRCVVDVDDLGGAARVTCEDGSRYETDALIGADGIRSRVRRTIVDDEPVVSRYVAYRGTFPLEQETVDLGLDSVVAWIGPELHLVQYPLRKGRLYNQVAVFKTYRRRLDDDWGTPVELERRFAPMCGQVREAVGLLDRSRRWPMSDRRPARNWTRNTITLLGDAAHPMLQYLAQGACQALEDAAHLAECVRTASSWREAFSRYEEGRAPRAARVQTSARIWGDLWHLDGVGAAVRDEFLATFGSTEYSRLDWLYGNTPVDTPRGEAHRSYPAADMMTRES